MKFTSKEVGRIKIESIVTENDIEDVIVGALEGGSNYWLGFKRSQIDFQFKPKGEPVSIWITKLLLEGKTIETFDIEDDKQKIFDLNLEKLIKGIQLNAIRNPDREMWDAEDCDCVIQYALFDEIIFG